MNNLAVFALLSLLLIGSIGLTTVAASELYKQNVPSSCTEMDVSRSFIWLPHKVSDIFMDDSLILHFAMLNGKEITVSGVVGDGGIYDLSCEIPESRDYEVWMSDLDALSLTASDKPITRFVTLWRTGAIRIEADGSENEQKLAYADQLLAQDDEPVPEWIQDLFSDLIE
ncbi:MAG: hypothetical protein V1827_00485 [Candidatus Micrarchaeota archaeon]